MVPCQRGPTWRPLKGCDDVSPCQSFDAWGDIDRRGWLEGNSNLESVNVAEKFCGSSRGARSMPND